MTAVGILWTAVVVVLVVTVLPRALHHLQSAWWADAQDADAAKAAGNGTPRTPGTGWPVATSPERTTS